MTDIIKTIKKTIDEHDMIPQGSTVVLGLSGGPDSICLFDALLKLAPELGFDLRAVHVNHELRGEDAERDQEFVENVCLSNGVPLDVTVFDCQGMAAELGITTEEAGRIKRYEAFDDAAERAAQEGKDPVIAVAHNYDDQAETIMFRLMRGTGPDGLAGMEYVRQDERGFDLVRPLLDIRKEDILRYCEENGLSPRIDKTNSEAIYSRNSIRLEVFPFLEKYSPNFRDALVRLGNIAREDKAFLRSLAEEVLDYVVKPYEGAGDEAAGEIVMARAKLRKVAGPVRRRVIALACSDLGLTEDLTSAHFDSIDDIIMSDSPSAGVDLPHGYRIANIYEDIRVMSPSEDGVSAVPGKIEIVTKDAFSAMVKPEGAEEEKDEKDDRNDVSPALINGRYAAFDADALELVFGKGSCESCVWRRREPGDYITIPGGAGAMSEERGKKAAEAGIRLVAETGKSSGERFTKKLQDIFVDDKVPKDDRDKVYFAAIGKEILFIPKQHGVQRGRWAAGYEVTQGTRRVLLLTL